MWPPAAGTVTHVAYLLPALGKGRRTLGPAVREGRILTDGLLTSVRLQQLRPPLGVPRVRLPSSGASVLDTHFMVIHIKLIGPTIAADDDPLGRTWFGYDADATPEDLWDNNRGDYRLDAGRIAGERWAALNYQGSVVLVAELNGPKYEVLTGMPKAPKKALLGHVLRPGNSVHDALIGTSVAYDSRNSIQYGLDPLLAATVDEDPRELWDRPESDGQGLQMDIAVRQAIEDAAQDRLMRYYRERGWTVTDTRLNRPYDAVAVKGTEEIYLEAKGTQSAGHSVILTRNEVDHARKHPGQCRIGVWSGMRLMDGVVDSEAGSFRVFALNPEDRDLRPRDFDWTLPGTSG